MISQAEYRRLKSRLTRRENAYSKARAAKVATPNSPALTAEVVKAARELRAEAYYGLDIFEDQGYPDAWHRWQRAHADAVIALRRYCQ
jgi:hypothetical protein